MFLRSEKSYPETDVHITLVMSDNKRSSIALTSNSTVRDLFAAAYNRRLPEYADVSLESYQRAVNLSFQGVKLTSLNTTLARSNISTGSVIRETFKKWVAGINVDKNTLTVTDPISLEPIQGKPYLLPDCNHALEKEGLTQWITQCIRSRQEPDCPCCRTPIPEAHIDKLVPVRPEPDPVPDPDPWLILQAMGMLGGLNDGPFGGRALVFQIGHELFIFFPPLINHQPEENEVANLNNLENENEEPSTATTEAYSQDDNDEEDHSQPAVPRTPSFHSFFSSSDSDDNEDEHEDEHAEEQDAAPANPSRKRKRDEDDDAPTPGF